MKSDFFGNNLSSNLSKIKKILLSLLAISMLQFTAVVAQDLDLDDDLNFSEPSSPPRDDTVRSPETPVAPETRNDSRREYDSPTSISGSASHYNDGKTLYATSATRFELTATDNTSGDQNRIEYKLQNTDFLPYEKAIQIEEEGRHVIIYRSQDRVGNWETQKTFEVVIDNTPPDVFVSQSNTFFENNGIKYQSYDASIKLEAKDRLSGLKKIEYALADSDFQDYDNPISISQTGLQPIRYRAIDNLGNTSKVEVFNIVVDGEAPEIRISSVMPMIEVDGSKYTAVSNSFVLEAVDKHSGVKDMLYRLSPEDEFKVFSHPLSFSAGGVYTIEAKAVDNVGNESDVTSMQVNIDIAPPETKLVPVSGE